MALPINIDDLVNHRKVESAIDYFTFVLPVHKYFRQSDAETMRELNATDDPITVPVTDPVPYQYRTSTVPVTDPVKKLLVALRNGPCSPSDLRIAVGIKHRQTFRANYLNPALRNGFICVKDGISPHDPSVCYSLTNLGSRLLQENSSTDEKTEGSVAKNRTGATDEENHSQNEVVNESKNEPVNEPVKIRVLRIISTVPGVSRPILIARTGKSRATITRVLSSLVQDGKVEHRGSDKTGGYYTTNQGK